MKTRRDVIEFLALSLAAERGVVRSRDLRADARAMSERLSTTVRAHAALALADLARDDKLERVSRGTYAITAAGREALLVLSARAEQPRGDLAGGTGIATGDIEDAIAVGR